MASAAGTANNPHLVADDSPPRPRKPKPRPRGVFGGPPSSIITEPRVRQPEPSVAEVRASIVAAQLSASRVAIPDRPYLLPLATREALRALRTLEPAPRRFFGSATLGGPAQLHPVEEEDDDVPVVIPRPAIRATQPAEVEGTQAFRAARRAAEHGRARAPAPYPAGSSTSLLRGAPAAGASSRAATRVLRRRYPTTVPGTGARFPRYTALKHEDLWVNGIGPPEQLPQNEHHKCGICHMVKSHPVSYLCGHSHCYVCIRLWLEREWTCPECVGPMSRPPFRQYSEEAWIEDAYPDWKDTSVVDYSWDGLMFPRHPMRMSGADDAESS